jgi:CheY-like chemotaxis protein
VGARILVVEDNPVVRELYASALRTAGYTIVEARHGAEAESLFEREAPIDLVITDIRMPFLDGLALAGWLRERSPDLPILLVTGHGAPPTLPANTSVLLKPFVSAALLKAVRRLLDVHPAPPRDAPDGR